MVNWACVKLHMFPIAKLQTSIHEETCFPYGAKGCLPLYKTISAPLNLDMFGGLNRSRCSYKFYFTTEVFVINILK
jgi:hypothetical protein